jgi:hypothetical protein
MEKSKIKFNFYSKIMLQTITVYGSITQNWHGHNIFKVDRIINNNRQEIIASEVYSEASEHFDLNKKNISSEIID